MVLCKFDVLTRRIPVIISPIGYWWYMNATFICNCKVCDCLLLQIDHQFGLLYSHNCVWVIKNMKINLHSSSQVVIIICELFIVILATSKNFGRKVSKRNHNTMNLLPGNYYTINTLRVPHYCISDVLEVQ